MTGTEISIKDIDKKIKAIFLKRFEMDLDKIQEDFRDTKFLGRKFGMAPRDLLYLFFDVEKEFNIVIPQESIANGEFSTYNGVCEIIRREFEHG